MPYSVSYQVELPYIALPGFNDLKPALQIVLHQGDKRVVAVGILDSGASHTVFSGEIAELLGITDLSMGSRTIARRTVRHLLVPRRPRGSNRRDPPPFRRSGWLHARTDSTKYSGPELDLPTIPDRFSRLDTPPIPASGAPLGLRPTGWVPHDGDCPVDVQVIGLIVREVHPPVDVERGVAHNRLPPSQASPSVARIELVRLTSPSGVYRCRDRSSRGWPYFSFPSSSSYTFRTAIGPCCVARLHVP